MKTNAIICAIASGLWLGTAVASMYVYPTVLSVAGSLALGLVFGIRAFRYARRWDE